jgi:arylsulfatase A-like enzyme
VFVTRRHFLAGAVALAKKDKKAQPDHPPSILLILADDLAAWMLGIYGNKEIQTPGIDLLARQGTRFTNHMVCTPVDSASRATLLTGRTPMQHGIQDFLTPHPVDTPPQGQLAPPASFAQEVMLSDLLAAHGYQCGYVGKWHMGADEQPQHGFKYWYTMLADDAGYRDPAMSWNGQTVQEKGYLPELITQKAVQFLDGQKAGQPFLLVASYPNAHGPYEGHPQKYSDLYAKTRFETLDWQPPAGNALEGKEYLRDMVGSIRKCAAGITALDDQIPVLLNKLNQRGLRDDTLVIFTSANGFLLGRHGLWSDGHASYPPNMFEEVLQTPMIWSWLGKIPAEIARPDLMSAYDLLPTLCEVTGIEPPARNLCGRSYLPIVLNHPFPKKAPWRNVLYGHFRDTDMCHDSRFKVVVRANGLNELYDIRNDPREKVNQYGNAQFLAPRDALSREIGEWRAKYSS